MAEFEVKVFRLPIYVEDERKICKELDRYYENIISIGNNLGFKAASQMNIKRRLQAAANMVSEHSKSMNTMSAGLDNIVRKYADTEQLIIGESKVNQASADGKDNAIIAVKPQKDGDGTSYNDVYEIDSPLYDKNGLYGGDQTEPKSHNASDPEFAEYAAIIRSYYPEMTDAEIEDYLKKLSSEGCGYVALCNTILQYYKDDPEGFEKTFGFPLYNDNGDFNYSKLLVDMYCDTDNRDLKGVYNDTEDYSATSGYGTTAEMRMNRVRKYLNDKESGLYIKNIATDDMVINAETLAEYAEKGTLAIDYHYGYIYEPNRTTKQALGGHMMVVTGYTDDGRVKVSSWGNEYYLNLDEVYHVQKTDSAGNVTSEGDTYYNYELYVIEELPQFEFPKRTIPENPVFPEFPIKKETPDIDITKFKSLKLNK